MALVPETALVRRNGAVVTVPIDSIVVGDEVMVKTGERVPVDGVVIEGEGWADESAITGGEHSGEEVHRRGWRRTVERVAFDARPRRHAPTRVGENTALAQIIRLVDRGRRPRRRRSRVSPTSSARSSCRS